MRHPAKVSISHRPNLVLLAAVVAGLFSLAVPATAAQVEIPDTTTTYGASILLPVRVTGLSTTGVVAAEVNIVFDPAFMQLDSVAVTGSAAQTWLLDTLRVSGVGQDTLKVATATASDTMLTDGVLLYLAVRTPSGRSPASSAFQLAYTLLNAGLPAATSVDGAVTVVGADAVVTITPASITPGDPLQLIVDDADADTSAGIDSATFKVTAGGDSETLQVIETTPGHFETSLATAFSASYTAGDGLLQVSSGAQISLCFTDSLDAAGATVERCETANVIGGTDGSVEATVSVQAGDSLRIRVLDIDLNSTGSVDFATATVINPRTGEQEAVTLTETGPNTSAFFGTLATLNATGPGIDDDGQLEARRPDLLSVEYIDAATASGGSQTRIWSTTTLDLFGDASGNGGVRGFDASLILNHSVGAMTLTGADSLSANLDVGAPYTKINAFDASLILQQRVGLLGAFPVRNKDSANHPQPESGAAPRAAAPPVLVRFVPTEDGWILQAETDDGIYSGDIVIQRFRGQILAGDGLPAALIASRVDGNRTRVSFAASAGGRGALLRLVTTSTDTPEITQAEFDGGRSHVLLTDRSAGSQPGRFLLHPATPNPFNPSTVISFDLEHSASARLWIVNSLGQTVRTLLDGTVEAGQHSVHWDGRDDQGRGVAAGVYFHRLQTPDQGALGKMTLTK